MKILIITLITVSCAVTVHAKGGGFSSDGFRASSSLSSRPSYTSSYRSSSNYSSGPSRASNYSSRMTSYTSTLPSRQSPPIARPMSTTAKAATAGAVGVGIGSIASYSRPSYVAPSTPSVTPPAPNIYQNHTTQYVSTPAPILNPATSAPASSVAVTPAKPKAPPPPPLTREQKYMNAVKEMWHSDCKSWDCNN